MGGSAHKKKGMMWRKLSVSCALVVLAMCAQTPPALRDAQLGGITGAAGAGVVSPSSGAYASRIDIDVPDYYNIEPKLALVYNSGGEADFPGVGWSLSGDSFIQRVSSTGGAPSYDATDKFVLDGTDLLPCTTLGGTHCTKQQNYQRIQQDMANNQWNIWEADGTKKTYTWLYCSTGNCTAPGFGQIFRWALKTEQDTNGNIVTYNYWCDPNENCYLDTITYNSSTIKLWREARPDHINFNNGVSVGHTNYRLKTIEVRVDSIVASAYKLTYTTSPYTARSLLASVQKYGRDVVLDGSGTVTGGTSLPAMTMTYTGESGFDDGGSWTPAGNADKSITGWATGDYNGDGKTDIARYVDGSCGFEVRLSTGTGFAASSCWTHLGNASKSVGGWALGDYNGDGKTDIARYVDGSCGFEVLLSTGSGFGDATCWTENGAQPGDISGWKLGDYNGDGKTDIARYWSGSCGFDVFLSNGHGFSSHTCWTEKGTATGITGWALGDFNGDHMTDIARYRDNECGFDVYLSNGSEMTAAGCWTTKGTQGDTIDGWALGDYNGDGATDIARYVSGSCGFEVFLSNGGGTGMTPAGCWTPHGTPTGDIHGWGLGDYNSDGKTDIARYQSGSCGFEVWLSTGSDMVEAGCWTGHGNDKEAITGWAINDYNGDGSPDLGRYVDGVSGFDVLLGKSAFNDLLVSMTNGKGGTTTIAYTPSSTWPSVNTPRGSGFPTVSRITVSDGRGVTGVTNYSYADVKYAVADKSFLGFGYQKAIVDAQGTYVETYNRQTSQSAGHADAVYVKNSAGAIYGYTTHTYTEAGDGSTTPYTSLITSSSDFECNLTTTCRESRTTFDYDAYANQIQVVDYGDTALNGDERTKVITYSPNISSYIVARPQLEQVYSGTTALAANKVHETRYYYDGAASPTTPPTKGNLTRTDSWNDQTNEYSFTSGQYDQYGNRTAFTDARGKTETTTYDTTHHTHPILTCNALNQCVARTWDYVLCLPTAVTDANAATIAYSYDALGRKISETDADGNVTTWQFLNVGDPNNQRVRMVTPDGSTDGLWMETYSDGLGRDYKVIKEGPAAGLTYIQEKVYSDGGTQPQRVSLWYPSGGAPVWETHTYDGAGRLLTATHPDGSFAALTYTNDASGKPYAVIVNELGHERATWIDTTEKVTRVREKNGTSYANTYYSHDALGNLVQVIDQNNNTSTFTYDSLGRKVATTGMNMGTWTYTYDAAGQLLSQTDAKGQTTTYTYDDLGRIKTKTAGGQTNTWYYDEVGHGASIGKLTRVVYPSGSEAYTYNQLGLTTATTQCIETTCKTIGSSYDSMNRLHAVTYPDGEVVSYGYTPDGHLASMSGYIAAMAWAANGQLTQVSYANGTTANYTYDPQRLWLTNASVKKGTTTLYNASYTYNAGQLVTSMTQSTTTPQTTNYTYDDLERLTSVNGDQSQIFTYDPVGNMTANSQVGAYTYGDATHPHAVTMAGSTIYTYDANGNMTSGGAKTFDWDTQNRLVSVTQAGTATTFSYAAGEQRIKKTHGTNTTLYFGKLMEVVNGSPVQYYYAGSMLVAKKDAGEIRSWYHADRLGSIRLLTDASGAPVNNYDYKSFGETLSSSATVSNDRGFTGHIDDADTGLLYMGARYYDATLGRFLSPDTLVTDPYDPRENNRYSYVNNNPINNTDPTGHIRIPAGFSSEVTWTRRTVTRIIEIHIPYIIVYPTYQIYWLQVSVSSPPIRWWDRGWHYTQRIVTFYVPVLVRVWHVELAVRIFRFEIRYTIWEPHVRARSNGEAGQAIASTGSNNGNDGQNRGRSGRRRVRSPTFRCENCDAPHGGLRGAYCPDCDKKSKDPYSEVPKNPRPGDDDHTDTLWAIGGGVVLGGAAIACAVLEPCGVLTALGLGGGALAWAQ